MSALQGKGIVVTRAPHQAVEFERLLRERGAIPLLYPCIEIVPPDDPTPLDAALREAAAGAFDWLVLTSANVVFALAKRIGVLGVPCVMEWGCRVAAVGAATAEAAYRELGVGSALIPETFTAEHLVVAMQPLTGASVLLPQSAIAGFELQRALMLSGAHVTAVEAYRTVIGSGGVDLPHLLRIHAVDAVTFTSPSTVVNFLRRLEAEGCPSTLLAGVPVVCIGTKTAAAARKRGLPVHAVPEEHTLHGLLIALERIFSISHSRSQGASQEFLQ